MLARATTLIVVSLFAMACRASLPEGACTVGCSANGDEPLRAEWAERLGGPGAATPRRVAMMPTGEVIVAGFSVVAGSSEAFLAKMDSEGSRQWVRFGMDSMALPSTREPRAAGELGLNSSFWAVDVNASGDIAATGAEDRAFAVERIAADGRFLWRRSMPDARGQSVAIAPNGDVLATATVSPRTPGAAIAIKLDARGAQLWSVPIASYARETFISFARGGAAIAAVNVISLNATRIGVGANIIRLSPNGSVEWTKRLVADWVHLNAVRLDGDDALIVAGVFDGTLEGSSLVSNGHMCPFVAKLSKDGDLAWARCIDVGSAHAVATGVGIRSDHGVVVTGLTYGKGNESAMFVAELTAAGETLRARHFGFAPLLQNAPLGTAVGAGDRLALTGSFHSAVRLGDTSLESPRGSDGFVALLELSARR